MGLCSLAAIHLGPNYGGGNEDNGNLLQKIPRMYCYTQCTLQQATTDPHCLVIPGLSWASLDQSLWGHCSFLLGPVARKILFVPSKSLFPSPVYDVAALWRG